MIWLSWFGRACWPVLFPRSPINWNSPITPLARSLASLPAQSAWPAHAVEILGDRKKAILWLAAPNRALGGEAPFDLFNTDLGDREVEDLLGRIAYGVCS